MKWKRPSGTEIETLEDDNTIAHCKSMGWEPVTVNKKNNKKDKPSDDSFPSGTYEGRAVQ